MFYARASQSIKLDFHGLMWYTGLETHFTTHPYIALLNEISVGGTKGNFAFLSGKPSPYIDYTLGMRTYLGTPYLFLDFGLGAIITKFPRYHKSRIWVIVPLFKIDLGFNIPITDNIKLQTSLGWTYPLAFDFHIKAGLRIEL